MSNKDLNIALILKLVDHVTAPARGVKRVMQGIHDQSVQMGQTGVAWSNQQIASNQARKASLMGEAFGVAALAGSLAAGLRPAVNFEEAMDGVAAVSRASSEEQTELTKVARRLGADTAWSATQAAGGMRFLAQAGFEVNEITAAMPGMLSLASAGQTDLARTSDIASNILTGFNLKASEMARLGDVLTNTFTSSNTDLNMLGDTMKYVAPNAAALNISLEQTAAMVGKLGDAGIQGSQAGTSLRAMMLRLSALPKPAREALEGLNVATVDAKGNLRDMPTVLGEIDAAMQDLGSGERAKLINDIFGMEAASAATVLLQQAGTGALQTYAETLKETGSATRVAQEQTDNAAGTIKRLKSIAESVAITIGNFLIPELAELGESVIPLIKTFQLWAEANPELVSTIFKLIGALLLFKVGSLGLRFVLFSLLGPVLQLIRLGSGLLILLPRLSAAMLALLRPMKMVRGSIHLLKLAIISTGVGGLIVGIATAGTWIYNNWSGLGSFFKGLWKGFRDALGPAGDKLDVVVGYAQKLWEWLGKLIGPIDASAEDWASWGEAAGGALGRVVEGLAGFISGIFDHFLTKIEAVRAAFNDGLLNGVLRAISEFNPFTLILEGLVSIYAEILNLLGVPEEIVSHFRNFKLNDIGIEWMTSLWEGMASILPKMIEAIKAKLAGLKPQWLTDLQNWAGGRTNYTSGPRPLPPGRDTGGVVRAGELYEVGERGREWFVPGVSGSILPTRALQAAALGASVAGAMPDMASSNELVTSIDYRPAMPSVTQAPQVTYGGDNITFHIHMQPGMDADDVARTVARELERMKARKRATLHDAEHYE